MISPEIPSDFDPGRFFGSFFNVAKAVLITPKVFFLTLIIYTVMFRVLYKITGGQFLKLPG